ncbi:hypothetical protein RZS08_15595, partial [Arthrospira platensis SPKY1]|nr:hypothetical protein [Arthrospira platensis SPKY1]
RAASYLGSNRHPFVYSLDLSANFRVFGRFQEPLLSFLAFFSAFFSFGVLVGFFLVSFLMSAPLLILRYSS